MDKNQINVFHVNEIKNVLFGNPYVGRGIMIGNTPDGTKAVFAYFIMGRSENSRNRIFLKSGNDLEIRPFDESKVDDPSLIIYYPVRDLKKIIVVTNGDQTDTIRDYILSGSTFESALDSRCFEPDSPNWTPRISGIIYLAEKTFKYKMSILKSIDQEGTDCARYTYSYPSKPGIGHFIHTYFTDGNPIPSFFGEPEQIAIPDSIDDFTNEIWNNLDESNRISLYTRYTDIQSGEYTEKMINKHLK